MILNGYRRSSMNAETNVDSISWLHGLQDYFVFADKKDISNFCSNFLKVLYSENKAPVLRNAILEGIQTKEIADVVNFFSHTVNNQENMKLEEISSALQLLYPNEELFNILAKYYRSHTVNIADAFSRGQVNSKIWAMQELQKIQTTFDTVYVLGAWFGQIRFYLDQIATYDKIRFFDVNPDACEISDKIFNNNIIKDYKGKSVQIKIPMMSSSKEDKNMAWVTRTGFEYNVINYSEDTSYKEKTQPSLIFNTSAEHMPSIWYQKIINRPMPSDPLFVIQSNNLFDVEEHVNCVHSVDHMCKKFPMSRLEYAGEKEMFGYKRFMVIGRP